MKEGSEPLPLFDMLFEITMSLCDRFPAYTPTAIRSTQAHEIFLLISRMNKHTRKEKATHTQNNSNEIRVPAGDNWF